MLIHTGLIITEVNSKDIKKFQLEWLLRWHEKINDRRGLEAEKQLGCDHVNIQCEHEKQTTWSFRGEE